MRFVADEKSCLRYLADQYEKEFYGVDENQLLKDLGYDNGTWKRILAAMKAVGAIENIDAYGLSGSVSRSVRISSKSVLLAREMDEPTNFVKQWTDKVESNRLMACLIFGFITLAALVSTLYYIKKLGE